MKRSETVKQYINRFEKLRTRYFRELEINNRSNSYATRHNLTRSSETEKEIPSDDRDATVELKESQFIKYFINGLRSRTIKRVIKMERHKTLKSVIKAVREAYDDDSESEDSENDSSESFSSDDDSEEEQLNQSYKPRMSSNSIKLSNAAKSKEKNKKTEPVTDPEISQLVKQMNEMTLMMGEIVKQNSQPRQTSSVKGMLCYNCQESGHVVSNCTNPCKLCKDPEHRHFQCKLYVDKRDAAPKQSTALLVDLLAAKRNADEVVGVLEVPLKMNTKRNKTNEAKEFVTRSGKLYGRNDIIKGPVNLATTTNPRVPESTNISQLPNQTQFVSPVTSSAPNETSRIMVNNVTYPEMEKKLPIETRDNSKGHVSEIIEDIMNRPAVTLSINELSMLSPSGRSIMKNRMTKPHKNPRTKPEPAKVDASALTMGSTQMKETIPRIKGQVNGVDCEMILDTGCSTFIISAHFAERIGITSLFTSNHEILLGNGSVSSCLGEVRDLYILVGDTVAAQVNAVCLDVDDKFDFIIGHPGMQRLGFGVDLSTQYWYFRLPDNNCVKAEVYYNNRRRLYNCREKNEDDLLDYDEKDEDESDYNGGFLLVMASDNDDEDVANIDNNKDPILSTLYSQVFQNELLNDMQKKRLIEVLEETKECFGTDYEHLEQTNLVQFHVNTGNHSPIYRRPYSFLSHAEREYLKEDTVATKTVRTKRIFSFLSLL